MLIEAKAITETNAELRDETETEIRAEIGSGTKLGAKTGTKPEACIAQLRAEGYGYKRIAGLLNMPLSTVKSICYRNGLGAVCTVTEKDVLEKSESAASESPALPTASELSVLGEYPHPQQSEEDPSACRQCGSHIDQTPGRKVKRFCSSRCRMRWWHAHKSQMNRRTANASKCAGCGSLFDNYGHSGQKYCSRACYFNHRFAEPIQSTQQEALP
jgi:hypothetical protein